MPPLRMPTLGLPPLATPISGYCPCRSRSAPAPEPETHCLTLDDFYRTSY
jgi:hypothetical protein